MIDIHWRAKSGTVRERLVLDCAREYGTDPTTRLFDLLLEDRLLCFSTHKDRLLQAAELEKQAANLRREAHGG